MFIQLYGNKILKVPIPFQFYQKFVDKIDWYSHENDDFIFKATAVRIALIRKMNPGVIWVFIPRVKDSKKRNSIKKQIRIYNKITSFSIFKTDF